MKGRAALLAGLAAGYVLGTRDGRERYEQIKTQAEKIWKDPRVQQKAGQAQDLAKEKAPIVQEKVSKAASAATDKAKSKVSSSDDSTPESPSTKTAPTTTAPATTPATASTGTTSGAPTPSAPTPRPTPGTANG